MRYHIDSEKDKIDNGIVIGNNVAFATAETLTLNGYEDIWETDWNVRNKDGVLVVENGVVINFC